MGLGHRLGHSLGGKPSCADRIREGRIRDRLRDGSPASLVSIRPGIRSLFGSWLGAHGVAALIRPRTVTTSRAIAFFVDAAILWAHGTDRLRLAYSNLGLDRAAFAELFPATRLGIAGQHVHVSFGAADRAVRKPTCRKGPARGVRALRAKEQGAMKITCLGWSEK